MLNFWAALGVACSLCTTPPQKRTTMETKMKNLFIIVVGLLLLAPIALLLSTDSIQLNVVCVVYCVALYATRKNKMFAKLWRNFDKVITKYIGEFDC